MSEQERNGGMGFLSWLARMCKGFGRMSRRLTAWGLGDDLVDESAFLTSMRT